MIRNKRGVTVAIVVTMVLVILLLTSTITISVNATLKSSRLRAFATEISTIQDTIDTYRRTTTSVDYITSDITIIPSTDIVETQFNGETVTDGQIVLHVIDLEKIGIEKTVYGKSKTPTDVYAVSFETGRVYYVKGYDASDVIYYTLTDELEKLLSGEVGNEIDSNNIIFTSNRAGWTNIPIQITVGIPTTIDITTVNITANVAEITISDKILNGKYNEVIVNTGNYTGNYIITVKYTLQGKTITQNYEVASYDVTPPVITTGIQNYKETVYDSDFYAYISSVSVTDNSDNIRTIKYAPITINGDEAVTYFENNGTALLNGQYIRIIPLVEEYTIYAKDYAGNTTIIQVPIDKDIYEMVKNWDVNWQGIEKSMIGTSPIKFSSTGANLINYRIYGNSIQNEAPTPETPIEIESVGEETKNLLSLDELLNAEAGKLYSSSEGEVNVSNLLEKKLKPNTQYTLSTIGLNGSLSGIANTNRSLYIGDADTDNTVFDEHPVTIVTDETGIVKIGFFGDRTHAQSIKNKVIKIQLEEGASVTNYEPYGYKIPVTIKGKNRVDYAKVLGGYSEITTNGISFKLVDGGILVNGTSTDIATSGRRIDLKPYLEAGKTYTASVYPSGMGVSSIFYSIENGTANWNSTKTITGNEDSISVYLQVPKGAAANNVLIKIQIEEGKTKTNYEPYVEDVTTNIYIDEPLRKIGDYADYIDFKQKKIVRKVNEKILSGNENWVTTAINGQTVTTRYTVVPLDNNLKLNTINNYSLNSHFAVVEYGQDKVGYLASTDNTNYSIKSTILNDLQSFKSWILNQYNNKTPVTVLYVLEAPIEKNVDLPEIITHKGTNIFEINTSIQPSKVTLDYYYKGT